MAEEIRYVEALYGTGVTSVDDQHRTLFEKINAVLRACEDPPGRGEVLRLFDDLVGFAQLHFAHEEGVMCDRGCGACDMNKEAHRRFERRMEKARAGIVDRGLSAADGTELESFLRHWVRQHTMTIDTRLRETVHLSR